MILFDPTKPRKAIALLNLQASKRKNVDPAVITAALDFVMKSGTPYASIRKMLVSSGHTVDEANALCDACFYQPAP
jgi:hypothetical protein